ncbi:MAG TPA: Ig-like domain-containing protein [Candidatus Saccharimonadales bacterium]|nr:Ig-like domain-containing protein [Candidatus Saccharimonadales bacterium]
MANKVKNVASVVRSSDYLKNPPKILPLIMIAILAITGFHYLISSHAVTPSILTPSQNLNDVSAAQIQLDNGTIMAMDRGARASSINRSRIVSNLDRVSNDRKNLMLGLLKSDPSEVNNLFLSDTVLSDLGGVTNNALEKKVTLSGTWQVIDEDNFKSQGSTSYELITSSATYELYSNGILPSLNAGDTVSINGYQFNTNIYIPASSSVSTAPAKVLKDPNSSNTGTINTAVIALNFANTPASEMVNMSKVESVFNGSPGHDVDDYFNQVSYGQVTINPTFYGPLTINENNQFDAADGLYDTCPTPLPAGTQFNAAASADGFNPSNYQRVFYVINCNYPPDVGDAGVGCSPEPCYAELYNNVPTGFYIYTPTYYIHELGHTFGVGEANFFQCGSVAFIPPTRFENNCASEFDGNAFDGDGTKGDPGAPNDQPGYFDVLHEYNTGWFSSSNYLSLSAPGTYTYKLLPYETPTNGLLALNIPRGSTGTSFTLEYRQPIGFDSWITPTSGYCPGCNITQGLMLNLDYSDDSSGALIGEGDTQAIDTNPGGFNSSDYQNEGALNDGALTAGKTFTDPETGISVTTNSADSTGATVTINIPSSASCIRNQPTVSLTSANTTVPFGQPINYTYKVTSNDSAGCTPEKYKTIDTYVLGAINKTNYQIYNFSGVASPDVFNLSPGQSTSVTISYIPDVVDPAGTYGTIAQNQSYVNGYLSADSLQIADTPLPISGSFTLTTPNNVTPPTQPANLVSKVLGAETVQLNWSASTDNDGVVGYEINLSNGEEFLTNQTSYTIFGLQPSTNYSFVVLAYDANLNLSQSASISTTTPAKTETSLPSGNNVTLSATDHTVTVSWQSSYDSNPVVGYEVTGVPGLVNGTFAEESIMPSSTNSVTYTNVPSNTTYPISVIAVDGDGNFSGGNGYANNSADTNYQGAEPSVTTSHSGTTPPTQPSEFHISSVTPNKVNLVWQSSTAAEGLAGYDLFRDGLLIAESTTDSYTDTTCGGTCDYYLEAVDNDGNISPDTYLDYSVILPDSSSTNTTPPTLASVTSPASGSTVSGTVNVSATAEDPAGISNVEFYIDNGASLVQQDTGSSNSTYNFSWDTIQYSNGPHSIWVVATDSSNNSATTNIVTVNVDNSTTNPPPTTVTVNGTVTSKKAPDGLKGVNVKASVSGSSTGISDKTNAGGQYSLTGLTPNQSYTYTFKLKGYKTKTVNEIYSAGTFELNEILKKL